MMTCPKCEASGCVKDGIVKGRQRYLCHGCKYRHTVPHRGKNPALKRQDSIDTLRPAAGVTAIEMDELHTYIGAKKTPAGSGWLWIAMQDNSSTAYWVPATLPRASNYGRGSKAMPSKP